jgi:hypothetical protein
MRAEAQTDSHRSQRQQPPLLLKNKFKNFLDQWFGQFFEITLSKQDK